MLGALSTQGGFLGNAGGLVSQYPLGLVGQIGDINKDIADNLKLKDSFGLAGAVASNVGGLLGGGTQMGNAGGWFTSKIFGRMRALEDRIDRMPLEYVLKQDYIREMEKMNSEFHAINTKLDKLVERLLSK